MVSDYTNSSKLRYLTKRLKINWITVIDSSLILGRYSSEYCLHGFVKDGESYKIFNYYGFTRYSDQENIGYFINNADFFRSIISASKEFNSSKAIYCLRFLNPDFCAGSYTFSYYVIIAVFVVLLLLYYFYTFFSILILSIYFFQNLFKVLLIFQSFDSKQNSSSEIAEFPIYSILIPLYMEPNKINFIINAISEINYPKNRLDVKLVIEEDDLLTQKELSLAILPKYFHIVKVPKSSPRTKPKALNYAIQYISGDYVVVYDAEDYPHPDQLIKALSKFNELDESYICVQAKLNFYNRNENLLTKFQSMEYTIWFEYLLQGLYRMKQFIPLGGTSCHFKVKALKKIGCWDPFNVTEDLDLGIRIFSQRYKTATFDSITLEEAVLTINAWFNQRIRWIKGFIQSYIVFCHNRKGAALSFFQKLVIDLFVGVSILNFLIPIYCLVNIDYKNFLVKIFIYENFLFSIIYFITLASITILKQNQKVSKNNLMGLKDWAIICLFPFYFILHTIASYLAIWQLIKDPFKWNKTHHGVSKFV